VSPLGAIPLRVRAAAAVILTVHAALFSWCAVHKSICFDEGAHVAAGVAYWRWGELSIYDLSPPLMRFWVALPAYLSHPNVPPPKVLRDDPPSSRHWLYWDRFQHANIEDVQRYVVMGRFMQLPISLALAIGIFVVAQRMYGDWAGVIACGIYCLDPTVLAQASTVGTDLAIAAALFAAVVSWARFLETRSKVSLICCALAVGAAHAIKFNALLIWPVLLVMLLLMRRSREAFLGLLSVAIASYLILNLSYGFQLWGRPMSWFHFESHLMQSVQNHLPSEMRVPFPQFMVEGFDAQKREADGAYVSVLFGKARFGGDWRYYPYMLLCKTPIAGLALVLCMLVSFAFRRMQRREIGFILLIAAIVLGMTLGTRISIGIRYLLPMYAPLAVLVGRLARPQWMALLALMAIEVGIAAPRFHLYANLAARHATLPDQDAGQSMLELRGWMRRNNVPEITIVHAGWTDPAVYGIHVRPLTEPRSDLVAISREGLLGIPFHSQDKFVFIRNWRHLSQTKPVASLDGMLIFRAEDTGADPWITEVHSWAEAKQDPLMIPLENQALSP
jgi:hypothetical protein